MTEGLGPGDGEKGDTQERRDTWPHTQALKRNDWLVVTDWQRFAAHVKLVTLILAARTPGPQDGRSQEPGAEDQRWYCEVVLPRVLRGWPSYARPQTAEWQTRFAGRVSGMASPPAE
jgi:hypothetical protein